MKQSSHTLDTQWLANSAAPAPLCSESGCMLDERANTQWSSCLNARREDRREREEGGAESGPLFICPLQSVLVLDTD